MEVATMGLGAGSAANAATVMRAEERIWNGFTDYS
jgi:4-diphosphocytidyl-2C-methyl-D-erythritol kinase